MAISAGPLFTFNPSVSFLLNFDPSRDNHARVHLDRLWEQLSEGGTALMPIASYPFSERYGWIQDRYGLSWQLMLTDPAGEERPFIIPSLMFTGNIAGRAEIDYYWDKLSADPQAAQCGWLKDQFGLSWQIWPVAMGEMMQNATPEQIDRLTQAFLPMKKFDLATLQRAYEGTA